MNPDFSCIFVNQDMAVFYSKEVNYLQTGKCHFTNNLYGRRVDDLTQINLQPSESDKFILSTVFEIYVIDLISTVRRFEI